MKRISVQVASLRLRLASAPDCHNGADGRKGTPHRHRAHEHRGERGQYYLVYFEGAVLIEDTWNPEFEVCRALVARGVTGRLEVWPADAGPSSFPRSTPF
jgi:hypothetical protein